MPVYRLLLVALLGLPSGQVDPHPVAPDRLAMASKRDGNWEIYLRDADGTERRLTRRDSEDRFPLWSPDGQRLAFASLAKTWELWLMAADGSAPRRIARDIIAKSGRGWCRDNRRLVFTARDGDNVDVYVADVETSQVTRLTRTPGDDRDPAWSPDCSRLVFSSMRDGNAEIYVMSADGSAPRAVAPHGGEDISPSWSPDGTRILFASDRGGRRDLHVVTPDGTGLRRLTAVVGVTRDLARWSPDGTRIAFQVSRDGDYEIGVVEPGSGRVADLVASKGYDGSFAWSPDGRMLAFISERDGFGALYRIGADGRGLTRLTTSETLTPAWAP